MKKFVSLLMCCVFAISAFAVFPQADEAITVEEAAALIAEVEKLKEAMYNSIYEEFEQSIADEALNEELRNAFSLRLCTFSVLKDGYKTVEDWDKYFKSFLTEEYVSQYDLFCGGIHVYKGNVYIADGFAAAPGGPYIESDDIKDAIRLIDGDTVALTASYEITKRYEKTMDFEYTENGWRISGGDALQAFLSPNRRNPDTSDNGILIVVCATAALVGIALTVNKRRFVR